MLVNIANATARAGVKRRVHFAHLLPVIRKFIQRAEAQTRFAWRVIQRRHHAVEVRLARGTGERRNREVGNIHAGLGGFEHRCGIHAAGVVRVKMNWQPHFAAQSFHQFVRSIRTTQPRHVFNAKRVGTHLLQLLRKFHVVVERIFIALRIEKIAGVTNGALAHRVRVAHRLHRGLEVGQIIERIENAKNIHAAFRRVFHKRLHHVVRIIRIANRIGATKEHLETDVRNHRAQLAQSVPRVFAQETHRGVKGRTAPHLKAEELRRAMRNGVGDVQHIRRTHSGGEEALVRIAQGGIGDEQPLLFARPLGEFFGALVE